MVTMASERPDGGVFESRKVKVIPGSILRPFGDIGNFGLWTPVEGEMRLERRVN